jgi:hypothetical protein
MTSDEITTRLEIVSALRRLGLELPHVSTPTELRRLEVFQRLAAAPSEATEDDIEAIAAGWSSWWRQGRCTELAAMARRLPEAVIDADRRLASFATAALGSGAYS